MSGRNAIEGIKPMTVVEDGAEISIDELAQRIIATREAHSEVLQKYHEIWYNCKHTWVYTHFLGVGLMKSPNDLWMYQAIMSNLRPTTVIETGTYAGGSALWFAYLQDMLGIEGGKVFTVDFEDHRKNPVVLHPRITFLAGNSINPDLVSAIKANMPEGPVLVCLDSDHSAEHVQKELELYAPLCKVGDWLVVEDTNIGWDDGIEHSPVPSEVVEGYILGCCCGGHWSSTLARCDNDKSDRGAQGGLQDYMDNHPNEWRQDVLSERYLLTMNPGGWLQRVAECEHG
jgi:cephalosporin hydroxylase